jgi:hypothetical protein
MANYASSIRSNYFKVKDLEIFRRVIESFGSVDLQGTWKDDGDYVTLIGNEYSDGWPEILDDEGNEISIIDEVATHLQEGQVAVFLEIGQEKMRYFVGHAIAINSKGERQEVSINDIYQLAEELKTVESVEVTRAEY